MLEELDIRSGDPSTMPELLHRLADTSAGELAVVAAGGSISARDLVQRSSALARSLLTRGCGKGTRIGILFPNGIEWVAAFDAITRIGAIAVPVNTFSTGRELAWVLRHADIDTLLMSARFRHHDYVGRLQEIAPDLSPQSGDRLRIAELPFLRQVLVWSSDEPAPWCVDGAAAVEAAGAPGAIDEPLLAAIEAEVVPADLAVIIYTSGTTSTPKGVVHTQGTVVRKSLQIARSLDLTADDRYYTNMPFFWVGGLMMGVLACHHAGCELHCTASNDVEELLTILRSERITRMTLFSPPATVLRQHPSYDGDDFAQLRDLMLDPPGGALGMTETFGMHSVSVPWRPPAPPGGMGLGTPGVTRRIVDPETRAELPPGTTGELWVRGPLLMDGYYKRERSDVFEMDGFFRTGDQCRVDDDGEIYWEGRLDEVIKSAGANVAPAEVEMVLMSFPEVGRAAVLGLPDRDRGTRVVAAVQLVEGATADAQDLVARMRTQLASYKVPTELIFMADDEIPVSATGKVLKPRLREQLDARVTH